MSGQLPREKSFEILQPLFSLQPLNVTSTKTISVTGFNMLTLFCNHVVNATATAVIVALEFSRSVDPTVWYPQSRGADLLGTGVYTIQDVSHSKTVAAADVWMIPSAVPIGMGNCRITVTSTAGGAADTFTMYGTLGTSLGA